MPTPPLPPLTCESLYHRICDASHHTGGFDTLALELSNEFKAHRRDAAEVAARHALNAPVGNSADYAEMLIAKAILAACPASSSTAAKSATTFDAIYERVMRATSFPWRSGYRTRVLSALSRVSQSTFATDEFSEAVFLSFKNAGEGTLKELLRFLAACPASPASPEVGS